MPQCKNYNLTVSGGSDVMTYNVNANYFKQDGILLIPVTKDSLPVQMQHLRKVVSVDL